MAKSLKDILAGVKSSKVVPGSTGKNTAVDYKSKAGDEADFVAKHSTEKHDDRNGNKDDIFQATNIQPSLVAKPDETRHGRKDIKASMKVNEAHDDGCGCPDCDSDDMPKKGKKLLLGGKKKPVEEGTGGMTAAEIAAKRKAGTHVPASQVLDDPRDIPNPPMSGNRPKDKSAPKASAAKSAKPKQSLVSKAVSSLAKAAFKGAFTREEVVVEGGMPAPVIKHKQELAGMSDKEFTEKHGHKTEKALRDMAARHGYGWDKATKTGSDHYVKRVAAAKRVDEEQIDEVLSKKAPPSAWIHDFVHSKNPKFAGKSTKERQKMALGAYYAKKRAVKEENVEEAIAHSEYHVSWGGGLEHRVLAKHGEDAIAKAKQHLITKIPKLKDAKYADTFKKKPYVHNLTAERKLQREHVEHLDELEKDTYMKYTNKAMKQSHEPGHSPQTQQKRAEGIHRAARLSLRDKIKKVEEDLAVPMLEDGKKKMKKKCASTKEQMDTPMTFPNMSVDVNTGRNV